LCLKIENYYWGVFLEMFMHTPAIFENKELHACHVISIITDCKNEKSSILFSKITSPPLKNTQESHVIKNCIRPTAAHIVVNSTLISQERVIGKEADSQRPILKHAHDVILVIGRYHSIGFNCSVTNDWHGVWTQPHVDAFERVALL
jgi:hypothetical protein